MPRPILFWSTSATRRRITPSASSRWIRFQHGVEDNPTRSPISATEREASSCSTVRGGEGRAEASGFQRGGGGSESQRLPQFLLLGDRQRKRAVEYVPGAE